LSAEDLWEATKHLLTNATTSRNIKLLYIATDEKNLKFFQPFMKSYTVKFLKDYYVEAKLGDLNQNHIGMIEQIIGANAHTFVGTPRYLIYCF
jgi:hypothetical protein